MENIIDLGWYISLLIFGSFYLSSVLFVMGAFGIAYVNDSEFKLPKWFCCGPFGIYADPTQEREGFFVLVHIIAGFFITLGFSLLWPLIFSILFIYLFLRLLRFTVRTKKSLVILKEQAHTHEKT